MKKTRRFIYTGSLVMNACERYLFSVKGIRTVYLFCQNGIQKGKGLEPRHIKLCRVAQGLSAALTPERYH